MSVPTDNSARKLDAASGTPQGSRGGSGSDAHAPLTSSPKPRAERENLNEASGPRQSTNPYTPAPGMQPKDIPLDEAAAKAKRRADEFNPTRPYDAALRRPGNEL